MQTMPTFVYLIPVVLFFGIGVSGAVVCTLIYALPPLIRIGGYGISAVSETTIEATDSAGQTTWQRLRKVQIPMARKTIIVGLNQTTMAALSMAIIASYVDGPGLGKPVLRALVRNDVGGAIVPGLLIVAIAIMLDRTTTAASERAELAARGHGLVGRPRQVVLAVTGVVALVLVWASRHLPRRGDVPDDRARHLARGRARPLRDQRGRPRSTGRRRPSRTSSPRCCSTRCRRCSPSRRGGSPPSRSPPSRSSSAACARWSPTLVCLAGIWYFDLWHDAMITLNMTLVATLLVMVLAIVIGVWMARRPRADLVLRPLLDAGQTIPAFVYLIPVLALFGPTRFTAIVAGVVYAAPAAIKLVADGVKACRPTTIEASRSTGTTAWQEITQVQLPMAKGSLVLADQPGPALRAGHGRHRRPGRRRRPRLRRRARLLPQRGVGQGRRSRHLDRAARDHARPHHQGGRRAAGTAGTDEPARWRWWRPTQTALVTTARRRARRRRRQQQARPGTGDVDNETQETA